MPRKKFDWTFWILWLATTTIGLAIALIVRSWFVGLIIGLAQWLVLWNRFPKSGLDPGNHHWVRIGLESSMESGDSNTALGMGKLALFYRMANCIRDIGFDRRLITMADTT